MPSFSTQGSSGIQGPSFSSEPSEIQESSGIQGPSNQPEQRILYIPQFQLLEGPYENESNLTFSLPNL
jgi:hypothetical protein